MTRTTITFTFLLIKTRVTNSPPAYNPDKVALGVQNLLLSLSDYSYNLRAIVTHNTELEKHAIKNFFLVQIPPMANASSLHEISYRNTTKYCETGCPR